MRSVVCGNPIIPNRGVCDPHVRVFGDRAWLYATHDASPDSEGFIMHDWWIWSSTDLINWTHENTLTPQETYFKQASHDCWATDAISRNGKYYFYFSMGFTDVGVVVGDSPKGPWTDPIGKPLLPSDLTTTAERDPGILMDDDGNAYIVFGVWDFYIARLNEDMVSLAEPPHRIILDEYNGPYGKGKTDDKPYLHKHNGKYYLSWGCYYAMSDNVYGPYDYKGSIITKERTAPEFQKGLTFDRHGSFFELHNQWYFICNDQSFPGSNQFFRNSVICYVHYRDNGEIEPVFLDRLGVGQYDASQGRIEAENYFKAVGMTKHQCPEDGFEVRDIRNGSYLTYPNVYNLPADSVVSFRVASGNTARGTIEVRSGSVDGPVLGICEIPNTGGWTSYKTVEYKLNNPAGKSDIHLVFKGAGDELLRLNWLSFK